MENNLEYDDIEITFEDVINYWITLFPELSDKGKFEEILKLVSNSSLEELEKEYMTYSNKSDINKYFIQQNIKINLDFIFDELYIANQWVYFLQPIIEYYASDLYEFFGMTDLIEDIEIFLLKIMKTMTDRMEQVSYKVMILETNVARMENKLRGNTAEEKALYFQQVMLKDKKYIKNIYMEYEELINILDLKVQMTFEFIKHIINDTNNHYIMLSSIFSETNKLGRLQEITLGVGDTHNKGKSVSVLHFTSGIKLVYKPRNLEIEKNFHNFINWINTQNINDILDLKAPKVYLTDNIGWVEWIEYQSCNNLDDIKNFYYRTGELLGILYAVNSKDFHYENIIAQCDYPILIDLESFLHPDLHAVDKSNATASQIAMEIITSSVDGIGLLPSPIINNKTNKSIDVGGVSAEADQVSPFKSVFIEDAKKDTIKIKKDFGIISPQKNNPVMDGSLQKSETYIDDIKTGFNNIYKWILKNKKLFNNKVKELFDKNECRVLFRSTYIYAQLLSTSYHPDLLRNPIDRRIYLHRVGLLTNQEVKDIVVSEFNDLLIGDIPFFYSYTNTNEVFNSNRQKVTSKILHSPMKSAESKISNFSLNDLERQNKFIDITYITKQNNTENDITNIKFVYKNDTKIQNKNKWLDLAVNIGDNILEKSIVGTRKGNIDRTWIGSFSADKENKTTYLTQVGMDLYGGNSGIALFLAYLGNISGQQRFIDSSIEAITPVVDFIEALKKEYSVNIGAFTGISGQIYSIYKIGKVFNNRKFLDIACEKILLIKDFIRNYTLHDIVGGIAGALAVILSLYDNSNDPVIKGELLELCIYLGKIFMNKAIKVDKIGGITWGEEAYVGFSHGNAGVTAYLSKLYNITKNEKILSTIANALEYERNMFDIESKNWYNKLSKENLAFGWCHGAPGILLNRIILKQNGYYDEELDNDISIALETTMKHAIGNNPSMCHGDLGNLRILNYAAEVLKDEDLKIGCYLTFQKLFSTFIKNKWDKGAFRGTENFGLMVGSSGFGYGCLQFYNSKSLSEILWLS